MKTAEEIKMGLECCLFGQCGICPYSEEYGCDCSEHLRDDIREYHNQLEAQVPRWISVEERLPESNDDVLVFVQHPISGHCWMQIAHHVSAIGLDECEDDEWWLNGSGETVGYITHWMPLPEPPKEV